MRHRLGGRHLGRETSHRLALYRNLVTDLLRYERITTTEADNELGRLAGVLNSTFARLESAFTRQRQFTADASHELRTPIAVLISEAQTTLARERTNAEYKETIEANLAAAQQMRRLTESLLALARLDAGHECLQRGRFDLGQKARQCVELLRPLATQRRIQIHCDLSATECHGDPERIGQVVSNLLTNAIHYNREDGEIRLTTRLDNGLAILSISDTGLGISAEDLPLIFERFYRADKSRSHSEGRSGLGLAISKAIVDAHGGSIVVSSKPGTGTTFTVRLFHSLHLAGLVRPTRSICHEYPWIYCRAIATCGARTLPQRPAGRFAVGHCHSRDSEMRKLRRPSRLLRGARRTTARRLRCLRSGPLRFER